MRDARRLLAATFGVILLAGCSESGVTDPGDRVLNDAAAPASAQATAASPVDVGGAWNWSNEEMLRFPPFVAAMLGIAPEGRNTHARCESAGTMTLVQTGATFQGIATKTFNACETKGGQPFQQPGANFVIADGRVAGGSVRFSFSSFFVTPCPHHAVISEVESGVAAALSGTGRCILPGHPRSESPVAEDPPPGGTSKTLSWEATRP